MYHSAHGGFKLPPTTIGICICFPMALRLLIAAVPKPPLFFQSLACSVGCNFTASKRDVGPFLLLLPLFGASPVVSSVGNHPYPIPSMYGTDGTSRKYHRRRDFVPRILQVSDDRGE